MKIIIAGAGAVGTHLAKLLSREHHDITLIDEDANRLYGPAANFDLLTLQVSPLSIKGLREAEVGNADLFISVTPDEAHNMTACMLAAKIGAKRTVARVENYEYTLPDSREFFKSVGISSIIYPEMLVGEEIMRSIRRSWTRQWIEVQGGALLVIGVKVRTGSKILNIPLRDLSAPDSPFHVVAIKRKQNTIIPHGDDCLLHRDVVYFMTTPKYVDYIRELAGKQDYPEVKNVVFLGGGSTTERALAKMPDVMHAKVFETDPARIANLDAVVGGKNIMYINADGRDLELLLEEGIQKAQAFVATTDGSETNILSCLTAKRYGVRKTVAMIENLDYVSMAESLDIGTILNKKTFAASHIYQMMLKADITTVKNLTVANADVAEIVVKEGSKATRHVVKDLGLPQSVTLGGLVRGGKGQLINGMTQIQAGDTVVAFCIDNSLKKIERLFN